MRKLTAIVGRLPTHELAIHRLYVRDMSFRTICIDYEDAQHALQHWQSPATSSPRRAKQFRQILAELEAELLGRIEDSLAFNRALTGGTDTATALQHPRRVHAQA